MNSEAPNPFPTLVAVLVLAMTTPLLATGQTDSLSSSEPPPSEAVIEIHETNEVLGFLVTEENGSARLPSPDTLRARSVMDSLSQKLSDYQDAFHSGSIPSIPVDDVEFENLRVHEGYLPNRTFYGEVPSNDHEDLSLITPYDCFTITRTGGTSFVMDASCSHAVLYSVRELEVRWDFEGDGQWDTDWSLGKVVHHTYPAPGKHMVVMEIRDPSGLSTIASETVVD